MPTPILHRFKTPANYLSLARLLLLIPLFFFLRRGKEDHVWNLWALAVFALAMFTDWLDGWIARRFRQESDWGRFLDPIADKLWINSLALFLALPWREHPLPWGFFALIVARDVTIVGLAFYAYRRTGEVPKSNFLGKVTMVAEAVTLASFIVYWVTPAIPWPYPEVFMWTTTVLIFISSTVYARRLKQTLTENSSVSRTSGTLKATS